MDRKQKTKQLHRLYAEFEERVRDFREQAVCVEGCADCCINVGEVHTTTLEALTILDKLKAFSPARRKQLLKRLDENMSVKENNTFARCAFLMEDNLCAVYGVRPFACRRLYSVRRCGETGPTVHREFWAEAERTAAQIHRLDDTGYSGHLSYILHLLRQPAFRKTYISGGFDPEAIREFAEPRSIFINRFQPPPET